MKEILKKGFITLSLSAVMFGVVGTAMVSADVQLEEVSPLTTNAGEYELLNFIIQKNWRLLSDKEKEKYLNNPRADKFFPFGIDVDQKAPKGYPGCKTADFAASYKPTLKLPKFCFPKTDS